MTNLESRTILFVFGGSELGGAERQGLLLARYLKDEHNAVVRVVGLGAEGPGRVTQLCSEQGIPWLAVPFKWSNRKLSRLKQLVRFARRIRKESPDIILSYTRLPNIACGLVWKFTGARLCIWNQRDEGLGMVLDFWHKTAVRNVSKIIANSEGGRDALVDLFALNNDDVAVIRNGVTLPEPVHSRAEWRRRLGLTDDCFVACMVANLHQDKDHATLLKAWRALLDKTTHMQVSPVLLLAGRFDGREHELKSIAFDLELSGQVRFLGKIDDISGLLHASDLCVHSSRSEGSPNSVLEAMTAGLPVVATDIPGVRDAVGAEGFRFLSALGDCEEMAGKIYDIITDLDRAKNAGYANQCRIKREFDPTLMCMMYVKEFFSR